MQKIYTFNEYLYSKYDNSIITRFKGFTKELSKLFCMPVVIKGLENSFKTMVSGRDVDIMTVTPRCILTFSGLQIQADAMTSIQAVTNIQSYNSTGILQDNAIDYRRLPVEANFDAQVVVDSPDTGIRLTEYIACLAMMIPLCDGDEHTRSTIIIDTSSSIDNQFEQEGSYIITFSVRLNMQIIEPMSCTLDDANIQKALNGVGNLNPDGTWDDDYDDEPITDPETGEPITDEEGNPIYGPAIKDGRVRLIHNFTIHRHPQSDTCKEGFRVGDKPVVCPDKITIDASGYYDYEEHDRKPVPPEGPTGSQS